MDRTDKFVLRLLKISRQVYDKTAINFLFVHDTEFYTFSCSEFEEVGNEHLDYVIKESELRKLTRKKIWVFLPLATCFRMIRLNHV